MSETTILELDEESAARLERLAETWHVAPAEVVSRSLAHAERSSTPEKKDPLAMLKALHERGGGMDPEKAEAYLKEVYEDRKIWRGK